MDFINDNGIKLKINDKFSYHGVDLVTVKNNFNRLEVYEPAYGVKLLTGTYNIKSSENNKTDKIGKDLDALAAYSDKCNHEKNYLPEIAFDIIENNKQVKNKSFNKMFIEKIEQLRSVILDKIKKGMTIGFAFTLCTSFAPKLAADTPITQIKQASVSQYNPVDFYKEKMARNVIDIETVSHHLNEDAKAYLKERKPYLKETDKRYAAILSETIKDFATSTFAYNYMDQKFGNGYKPFVMMDEDDSSTVIFYKNTGTLVLSEAQQYVLKIANGEVKPKLELNINSIKQQEINKNNDYGRGA